VGAKDVCVMYSVTDVAGVNRISRLVLGNAASAMAGMVAAREQAGDAEPDADDRPLIAASMFGVTTPAVETAKERLTELGYEVLVFHATGAGGRALEGLAEGRLVDGVLDLTTTELADDLVGGVLSAGPGRLTAAGAAGIPQVIAPGALDMVNFGPPDTVPERFAGRLFFEHNPTVTLMRTTESEMAELGALLGRKAAAANGPTEVFWPDRGVSALDSDGQPFRDAGADEACRAALERELAPAGRKPRRVDAHINDPVFATAMADRLHQMITEGSQGS
ncbi:MAG: Tm-1-like ATP-binding domain-containing protein, partial [Nocardiopsaceae bacterium]|nr:Tm-1-like ATP-binding domain-containing protein [Nocardiopsaceae bacterium]